jgi:hypothetical protein
LDHRGNEPLQDLQTKGATMSKARDFSVNDWMGFAGAEAFPGKQVPLIRDLANDVTVCADWNGIFIYFGNAEGDWIGRFLPIAANRELCRFIMDNLPEDLDLDFCRNLSFQEC